MALLNPYCFMRKNFPSFIFEKLAGTDVSKHCLKTDYCIIACVRPSLIPSPVQIHHVTTSNRRGHIDIKCVSRRYIWFTFQMPPFSCQSLTPPADFRKDVIKCLCHDVSLFMMVNYVSESRGSSCSQRSVSGSPDAIKQMQTCRWSASEKENSAL